MEWETFDAIYLINLPERTDRRRELQRELRAVGLGPDDARLVWVDAIRPTDAGEFPSIGARGCFLSHLTCLRSACERGYQRVLIIEDDARFPRLRAGELKTVIGKLKETNWAIWYGGHRLEKAAGRIEKALIRPIEPSVGVQTAHCIAFQGEAIASVRSFLELLLTRPGGHPVAGPMHVDGAFSTWRALNPVAVTLITAPPLCVQRSSRSDIAPARWFDSMPVVRQGVAALRRVRNQLAQQ